ncbi:alpha-galactosidase [Bifidobacterium psychraerophilum]|uniref:alpha-galactosidase n=1 Tax=Bifidobacterium psychraerophilum TaxID=218140 RepID=UPI0033413DF9
MASVIVHEQSRQFHLTNDSISYIMRADDQGKLLNLYYGSAVRDRDDFGYLVEYQHRSTATCRKEGDLLYSLEHLRQEYPEYGTGDYRRPAIIVTQPNGSKITDLQYASYAVSQGKPTFEHLPSTYANDDDEAATLDITLKDRLTGLIVVLHYTIFRDSPIIARSATITNRGTQNLVLDRAMSLSIDLPDCRYDMTDFVGAWARERHPQRHGLHTGIQAIESLRGASGHFANPTALFSRPETGESAGEAIGLAFEYSGDFDLHAEVDSFDVTRLQVGINDFNFSWQLAPEASFQTPEALIGYTSAGVNDLSHGFHDVVRNNIIRGPWKNRERPILINNWEATYFDFDEDKLVAIAQRAHDVGVELFVLDDGWFGARNNDKAGLGDWTPNADRLPNGLTSLARRINDLGMQFGLWFEPEMVNKDSDLFRAHPEWALHTPGRAMSHGRNEYVLNFADGAVVDNIYEQMYSLLSSANIAYIKWDMNRFISEGYDITRGAAHQGELFHRYIIGVYSLMERLLQAFPDLLIESCASGGGRFDMGMLYYSPQIWCSDDTDAVERVNIQYGTSVFYPLSSMGSHVSITPNHQTGRVTPLRTRSNVAMFGTFGYELDLGKLSDEEVMEVRSQVKLFQEYRGIIHRGDFYRLIAPYTNRKAAWMVVSDDRQRAIVGDYKMLLKPNSAYTRISLSGLEPRTVYRVECTGPSTISGKQFSGDELMRIGLVDTDASSGEMGGVNPLGATEDFDSKLFILEAVNEKQAE